LPEQLIIVTIAGVMLRGYEIKEQAFGKSLCDPMERGCLTPSRRQLDCLLQGRASSVAARVNQTLAAEHQINSSVETGTQLESIHETSAERRVRIHRSRGDQRNLTLGNAMICFRIDGGKEAT